MNQVSIGERIKAKREAVGLSVVQLSEILKVSKANLYKWEKGHRPSDPEDYKKIESWLAGNMENVPRGTSKDEKNSSEVANSEYQQIQIPSSTSFEEFMRAFNTLAESNKSLVDQNKVSLENSRFVNETNQYIAETNRLLAEKLIKESTIERVPKETILNDPMVLVPIVQVLAEIASGKTKFRTFDEAMAELGIRFGLHKPYKGSSKGTQSSVGK